VLSGRGLCDELITRPEESYRMWRVVFCDLETSLMRRPWPTGGGGGCYTKNKELISELLINYRCCGRIWCILIRQPHIIVVLTDNLDYVTMTHDSEVLSLLGNPLKLIQVTSFDRSRVIEMPGSMHVIQNRHIYHNKTLVNTYFINFKFLFILKLKFYTIF